MIPAALLLLQAQPAPPADWSALPELPVRSSGRRFDPSRFVRREVAAQRCKAEPDDLGGARVTAPVAVLIDPGGLVRRVVPQAIGCPTVEQYTAGYISTLARRAAATAPGLQPGWYRYTVTYRWAG